jgi:hypothetical protein
MHIGIAEVLKFLPLVSSWFGGFVVKFFSKKKGSDVHKVLSPLAALILGCVAALVGGSPDVIQVGAHDTAYVILGHTLIKNALQLIQKGKTP